jgi:CRISPR/Cas system CMR-associated protein Cmr5 small subunit
MMKNRDQIRAMNALASLEGREGFAGIEGGDAIGGFPALVMGNGLLATIAFCMKQGGDYLAICDSIARHLSHSEIGLLDKECDSTVSMLRMLTEQDSELLLNCTAETLSFLNFLRRFAKSVQEGR